jgi:hypothetical protein
MWLPARDCTGVHGHRLEPGICEYDCPSEGRLNSSRRVVGVCEKVVAHSEAKNVGLPQTLGYPYCGVCAKLILQGAG